MMQHRVFLPTAGCTTPLKAFDWAGHNMRVQQEVEPFPEDGEPVIMGINSFGIGGSYGHAILEEYRGPAAGARARARSSTGVITGMGVQKDETHLLALSAFSLPHLQLYAERLAAYLRGQAAKGQGEQQQQLLLRDMCATLWCHRSRFMYRRAFQATTPLALATQLEAFSKGGGDGIKAAGEGRKMQACFVFTGQGSQYPGVGRALMRFPVYRDAVHTVDKIFKVRALCVCVCVMMVVEGRMNARAYTHTHTDTHPPNPPQQKKTPTTNRTWRAGPSSRSSTRSLLPSSRRPCTRSRRPSSCRCVCVCWLPCPSPTRPTNQLIHT
jgi:acyl transferase domain-containing protein